MSKQASARAALCTIAATALVVGLSGAGRAAEGDHVVAVSGSAQGLFVALDVAGTAVTSDAPSPLLAADPATGDEVGAEQFDVEFGPAPSVTLPTEGGGPVTDSLSSIVVPQSPTTTFATLGLSEVSTEGALGTTGNVRSSSTNTRLAMDPFTATAVASDCSASAAGGTATSTLTDLRFTGAATVDLPTNPAPNTVLTAAQLPGLGTGVTVILNQQQIVTDATGTRVVVTALHITAGPGDQLGRGETYVGRSECGVVLGAVAAPTFTG